VTSLVLIVSITLLYFTSIYWLFTFLFSFSTKFKHMSIRPAYSVSNTHTRIMIKNWDRFSDVILLYSVSMMLKILDFTLGAVGGRGGLSFQSLFGGKQKGLERVVKIYCLNIGTIYVLVPTGVRRMFTQYSSVLLLGTQILVCF
jgi:hypothetical protein